MKLKDNIIFRSITIPICIALCLFFRFIPAPNGLTQDAMGVIGIFLGSLILWLTIGIDWPSLLCIFSLALLDSFNAKTIFAGSFGNETFIFLLFTFICTYSLSKTPLIKRIAIWFTTNKLAKKGGWWLVCMFWTSVLLLGLFISPSVLFVVMLPIVNEILEISHIEKGEKVGKMLLMGLGFTVSISSGMTPIAHVFPILAMNAANISIGYAQYMAFAIPVGILSFLAMILMFRIILKPDMSKLKNADISQIKETIPPFNKKEAISLIVFGFVLLLWIVPSLFKDINPQFYQFFNQYGTAMPAILGTLILCIIRIDGKSIIDISDAFKNGIPWSSLIMCASTLILGSAITNDSVGLKSFLHVNLSSSLASVPAILLLIIFGVWAMLQTNVSSNMVTATLVSAVASSVIASTGIALNLNAVVCIIGCLSSYAFATPPSMPHIAIVAGSEYCDTKTVLTYGSVLMIISLIIALCIGYPLATLVM